ncbi:Lpg1974 family pore-forming outer membrane protein [uncultured Hyphomicrobium sp.]|uniref:Lpg1974 family pore-forming outer membrane protein n=1 Tax=uncultured Hyphomicrobium sp. TaxID=194373 RepID=UPI0025EFFB49|nr:Lpg1974 family pore-forming outer membrane protein [uncultured Hyphomicrobium sp.]
MPYIRNPIAVSAIFAIAGVAVLASAPASAQTVAAPAGVFIEAEGQRVFGESNFVAGLIPPTVFDLTGPEEKLDEGEGWGGAATLGIVLSNGWSGAVRFRRLAADDKGGLIEPGIVAFAPQIPFAPGGFPLGVLGAHTTVDSEASMFDLEIGKELQIAGGRLQLYGGITYASIERDVALISESCGCLPGFALVMSHDFHGIGPKIGFRGGVPLIDGVSFVGGGSVAALIGTSTFKSRLDDPLFPPFQFKADDDRTVAALGGEAGLSFAIGFGNLTIGYRIDAVLGALDTDQRVSPLIAGFFDFPQIGDDHDNFVEHGPFARLTLPLTAAAGN